MYIIFKYTNYVLKFKKKKKKSPLIQAKALSMMRSPGCALGDGSSMLKVAPAHFYDEATKTSVSHLAYSKL